MAKNTFEKVMRNVDLAEKPKKNNFKLREKITVTVDIEPTDRMFLLKTMQAELAYYNALAVHFSSRIKAFPEHILSIESRWFEIYQIVAELGFDLNKLYDLAKKNGELPNRLEPYRDILLPKNQHGRVVPEERMILLIAPAGYNTGITPRTRKAIATEILRFYQEQAKVALTPVARSMQMEFVYRSAPETLAPATFEQKRHIQLEKESIDVTYDDKQECSYLKIPYISNTIKIPNINLVEENFWNHFLLHQEPRTGVLNTNSPWVVELQHVKNSRYLIKYLESKRMNQGRTFSQAKAR